MKYLGSPDFDHAQRGSIGVLVTNLGTPQAPEKTALRPYLKQFLSDPRVVEVPRLLWWFILNGIILNVRPARSAEAYRTVWTDEGSPLLIHTRNQATELQKRLNAEHDGEVIVDFAMRYGQPSIANALQSLRDRGARQLVVLPLYPQYSGPTGGSTFDAVAEDFIKRRWIPDFQFVANYHDQPGYISAVADSIRQHWEAHGRAEKLLFSYHGEPRRYLDEGDPYHCHCHKTTRLVAEELGLTEDEYLSAFQSRFGREEWLKPYTDHTLREMAGSGIRSVQVVCPGFSADCLETIEEIGEENRDYFLEAGGERYEYIPCLNSSEGHIDFLTDLVNERISPWLRAKSSVAAALTATMADAMKARSAA
ncbi:ferrochelatase [Congregibacter sp.]|uniref:ferrochelatase n=1 Tax=Congregibacter sp. TaxID=2744308 RepID=UPI00385DD5A0